MTAFAVVVATCLGGFDLTLAATWPLLPAGIIGALAGYYWDRVRVTCRKYLRVECEHLCLGMYLATVPVFHMALNTFGRAVVLCIGGLVGVLFGLYEDRVRDVEHRIFDVLISRLPLEWLILGSLTALLSAFGLALFGAIGFAVGHLADQLIGRSTRMGG
jgi:hypothetical protein